MIDLSGNLEVFMTTNGRSTFSYALQSIENQKRINIKVTVLKDMPWLAANRKMLKDCKSKYFARIDDDMIMHPHALLFMFNRVKKQDYQVAMRGWRLWEPYSNKVCKGVKIYSTQQTRKIGYRVNDLGKIDKCFNDDARSKGFKIKWEDSILGIHCCSTLDEHLKYVELRGDDKSKKFKDKKKFLIDSLDGFNMSLDQQNELRTEFLKEKNKQQKSAFYKYLKKVGKDE